jgi:hypothetical protein
MLRKEAGQALPMALILVFLGAAVIIPTLYFTTTNIKSTQVIDQKTLEAYAADAGINDALWHLQADERLALLPPADVNGQVAYNFKTTLNRDEVNKKDVTVTMDRVWVLDGLPNVPDMAEANGINNGNLQYAVMGSLNNDNHANYIADISTNETGTINLNHIGVWLPQGYKYEPNSVKINGVLHAANALVKEPTSQTPLRGGTALIWNYLGTTFQTLSDIAPPPSGGMTPAHKYPPSIRLSFNYTNNPVVTPFKEAEGFFPWIRLTTGDRIAWDPENRFFHVVSTGTTTETNSHTTVEAYVPTGVTRYVPGTGSRSSSALGGDYITIGNSLMTTCWNRHKVGKNYVIDLGPPCNYCDTSSTWNCHGKQFAQSSAQIKPDAVPTDAQIEIAYLYWTAWWTTNGADQQATLSVNGAPVGTGGTVAANTWYVLSTGDGYQYACFADVTDAVKAITTNVNNTTFMVGGVNAVPASTCASSPMWLQETNAAWSMVIIYSSQDMEQHQIYLYDSLAYLWKGTATFTITGFQAPATGTRDAKVGTFTAEGDPQISPDYFEFRGQHSAGYVYLGDPSSSDLNYYGNVFNSYSSATVVANKIVFVPSTLDGQPTGKIAGVDLEAFTQDKDGNSLSNIVLPGDTSANILVDSHQSGSGADGIMLVYIIFSVRSDTPPAGEGFQVGTMMYQFR